MEIAANLRQGKRRRLCDALESLLVDSVLLAVFLVEMNMSFSGLAIHEWLGIAAGAVLVIHLLLHWKWIVAVTRRAVGKLPAIQRIKYILDILLFVDMVIIGATGLWISEVAMRQIGVSFEQNFLWRWLHSSSADWAVWLIGLHLALNRKWVVHALNRYLWQPVTGLRKRTRMSAGDAI